MHGAGGHTRATWAGRHLDVLRQDTLDFPPLIETG